ncbi:uncharacterized protein LOC113678376 [Pocillopora damicornis]|uniref:uncharacterized protein LOC113678376 n=1 Tax=Pocillopora damicornis TaxID=46731 RepID=UPI000F555C6F|nr:uncharacterized protein LOC113678376 [Pocillopora damicornis]
MGIKRIIILVFFQFIIHLSALASDEGCNTNCSAYFLTKENKRLTGFVVQRFESQSLLSCSLTCLQQSWCTSINFKLISLDGKGICELNKSDFDSDTWSNLNAVPGVIFSKLLKDNEARSDSFLVAKAQKPRRGGILGSLSNGLVTNSGWKCSDGPFPGCKWMTQDFDDRMWPTAKEIVFHGPHWPTSVPGIVQGAKWIWSATGSGHLPQPIAYCRLNMS